MFTKRIFVSIPEGELFRQLYEHAIKPLTNGPFEVVCYYDHPNLEDFVQSISKEIGFCNLVICILSGVNPNVLYEVGLATGFGKPIIPVTDSIETMPSMLQGKVAVKYDRFKPDFERLGKDLKIKFDYLLHGDYMPLRMRTHAELLLQRPQRPANAQKAADDPLARAIAFYNEQQFPEAIAILDELLKDHPTDRIYFYLTDCHFLYAESMTESLAQTAHYEKFLEISLAGTKAFPAHRDLQKNLGLAYLKLRRLPQSKTTLARLVKEHPTFGVGRYNKACVHAQMGEVFDCLRELSRVVDQEPAFRSLARVDPDFEPIWKDELFQRLIFPMRRDK